MRTRRDDGPSSGPVFALRIGLGPVPASVDDVRREIGDRLDAFDPRLSQRTAELELSLTIAATDLWVAVLLAMSVVTGTGYPVVALAAQSVEQSADQASVAADLI